MKEYPDELMMRMCEGRRIGGDTGMPDELAEYRDEIRSHLEHVAVEHGVDPRELGDSNDTSDCVECGGMIECRLYERDDKPSHVCDSCLEFEELVRSGDDIPDGLEYNNPVEPVHARF